MTNCLCVWLCTNADPSRVFVCVLTDSLSAHRAHTHGRRVRHSSSDSSGSDSSAESCSSSSSSSSLHSRSRSPDPHPDSASPPPCNNTEVPPLSLPFISFILICVSLWLNSLQGAVASRRLTAGVERDGGMRNACDLESWRRRVR